MKTRYYFGTVAELQENQFLVRALGQHSVGVTLYQTQPLAILNFCPHAGAPVCQGKITPKLIVEGGQQLKFDAEHPVLRCPWHGWEFRLEDGHTQAFSSRYRLARLDYELEGEAIYIWV
jgi:nitrite reductase/ring-hydroxylating ferredoxin subunit